MRGLASAALLLLLLRTPARAGDASADDFLWVNLRTAAPAVSIDLRYATCNNIAGEPIYGPEVQPLIRAGVARKILSAQKLLARANFNLRIWDAYRTREAQQKLWELSPRRDYVADPSNGAGSMHSWGVAIDATLLDSWMRPVSMPTDFDDFSPAALLRYGGPDQAVRWHLRTLQRAMARAGFYGLRTEWWHFTAEDWKRYVPENLAKLMGSAPSSLR